MSDLPERRASTRKRFTANMEYSYPFVDGGPPISRVGSGVTSNTCLEGLAFVADRPLKEGQDIKLFIKQLSQNPLDARVRWCGALSATSFKIGVMLL